MQQTARLIAELVDHHRLEAHTTTSIPEKIERIDAMAGLRRIEALLPGLAQEELVALRSALTADESASVSSE